MAQPPTPRFSAKRESLAQSASETLESEGNLPPIVARMVVEIRSDGTKTIARGALEDLQAGERVALQADAATPAALAKELSRALLSAPALASTLAREAVKEMLPERVRNSPLGNVLNRLSSARDKKRK